MSLIKINGYIRLFLLKGVNMYAVIRVRGSVNVGREVRDTLRMLRLTRVNHCVVVPKTADHEGMLRKARSFITWGELSQDTLEKLVAKRGRLAGDRRVPEKEARELARKISRGESVKDSGLKPVFRLSPPSKGYRSVRMGFPRGDLGDRGEKINELLKRMI
jgi:large subunit ribosomal protein L30